MRHSSRVALLCVLITAVLVGPGTALGQDFAFEFGGPELDGSARLEIAASSIAVDADGNPWVADPSNDRIVKYTYDGTFVAEFKTMGDIPLTGVTSIAADDQGLLYLAQSGDPRVIKLDTGGRPRGTVSLRDPSGSPLQPDKLAVDGGGRLYVTNASNDVNVYAPTGGALQGRVFLPISSVARDVTVNASGIFVTYNTGVPDIDTVAQYGLDRRLISAREPFPAARFQELAVDGSGRPYVADYRNSVVLQFDFAASRFDRLGTAGIERGQMNGPTGMAIDCRGNVYVLDSAARFDGAESGPRGGSKVLKFAVAAEPPPCAPRPLPEGAIETQINDIDVTQAVQPALSTTVADGGQARSRVFGQAVGGAASGELGLKAGLRTIVRAYANLSGGPAGGLANIPATLEVTAGNGARLGELQPVGRPALLLIGSRTVDATQRTNANAAYAFELPDDWTTRGPLTLTARVNPANLGCDPACASRSTFRLTGVGFGATRVAPIAPIALTEGGRRPFTDPARAFTLAQAVTPLKLEVAGWQADVEAQDILRATDIKVEDCFLGIFPCSEDTYTADQPEFREVLQGQLMDRITRAAEDRGIDECDRVPIALARQTGPLAGAMSGEMLAEGFLPCALGYATVDRPLTSVAHELQHAFGRPHAGRACPGTGEGEDQEGEPWPPDDRGLFDGVGLNTSRRSTAGRGPFEVIVPGVAPTPAEVFDLMSYCAGGEESAWISPRGWGALYSWRVPTGGSAAVTATSLQGGSRALRVSGVQFASGKLGIAGVSPTRQPADPVDPSSPYVLEAMDEAGTVLASAPAAATPLPDAGGILISGTVPAPEGTRQVFLRRGTEIGTRRVGTPNAPTLRLLAPRGGERVASGDVTVRWSANDADGGETIATVEYSADGGRTWKAISVGPSTGRARLARTMVAGSGRARVRVRVDDGFNEAVATSKPFTVVPAAPAVSITTPETNLTIDADSPLTLRGGATAAFGAPVAKGALRWTDGQRRLGTGESITVKGLAPGRHRITLSVTRSGVTGQATRTVTVRGVKPAFLVLEAPAQIARGARSVRLRVASTVDATLSAGGKRATVTPKATGVTLPIKAGATTLTLTLQSGRLKTKQTITITRS